MLNLAKQKRIANKKYLAWIRCQPCCHCHIAASEPHHAIGFDGMMGSKAGDHFAVPLCRNCHTELHNEWAIADKLGALRVQMKWVHDVQARYYNEELAND